MGTVEQDSYKKVINKLIELVTNGTIKPNEKIYSENRLAQLLKIPRAQVREVYTALRILGVLYGKQGEGTYFKSIENEHETGLLYLMMLMDHSSFENIVSMRKILETGSAALAALNRTEEDLAAMKDCLCVMQNTQDPLVLAQQDSAFHFKIAEASGNPLVKILLQIVFGYISRVTKDHWRLIVQQEQSQAKQIFFYNQHNQIAEAIEKKQPDLAEKVMCVHMDSLIANMLSIHDGLALSELYKQPE